MTPTEYRRIFSLLTDPTPAGNRPSDALERPLDDDGLDRVLADIEEPEEYERFDIQS